MLKKSTWWVQVVTMKVGLQWLTFLFAATHLIIPFMAGVFIIWLISFSLKFEYCQLYIIESKTRWKDTIVQLHYISLSDIPADGHQNSVE